MSLRLEMTLSRAVKGRTKAEGNVTRQRTIMEEDAKLSRLGVAATLLIECSVPCAELQRNHCGGWAAC